MPADALLRPFDVPVVHGSAPDPNRLLVGQPDPRLAQVTAAWSNVPVVRRKKVPMAPLVSVGLLGAMTGAAGGLAAGSPLALAAGVLVGGGAGAAVVALVSRLGGERWSCYVGRAGYQRSDLGLGGVRDEIALYAESWLLFSRTRRTLVRDGRVLDERDVTITRFVPKERGARAIVVAPQVADAVRTAAVGAHVERVTAAASLRGAAEEPARFAILGERDGFFAAKGELVLSPGALEISDGARSHRVALRELRASLRAGILELGWPGDVARVPFDEIGDGLALLAHLERHGVTLEGA